MRGAGILLPITSLPDKYGIGCFSLEAKKFIDFLVDAGQSFWQILPIGPAGYGNSPYQSYSTFAINPLLIDIQQLIDEGELSEKDCEALVGFSDEYVDYEGIESIKMSLLKKAYYNRTEHQELERFASSEAYWLDTFALFMDIHDKNGEKSYTQWDEAFANPDWSVLDKYKEENSDDINFYRYLQFKAFKQWHQLKDYANSKNIKIVGDLPIYVSPDGADIWINRQLFQIGRDGLLENVAGCPGDDYAPQGQKWGNPLYDWEYHKNSGYEWWISRMKKALSLYDIVRIDHFRGFDEYFSIPATAEDATSGKWVKGPGMDLFNALKNALGDKLELIAEDLGLLTDTVLKLRDESGYPGMKVMQFAYGSDALNYYLPHNHISNAVVYTGTHDNMTTYGFLTDESTPKKVIDHIISYHGFSDSISMEELAERLVEVAYASVCNICIVPIQDHLILGNSARINTPSTVGENNWRWRLNPEIDYTGLAKEILAKVRMYGR